MSNKEINQYNSFKLPIEYLSNKFDILDNLKSDLELLKSQNEENKPIYQLLFNPKTILGKNCINIWSKYYTTNKQFLQDSQNIYKKTNCIPFEKHIIENMLESWKKIKYQNNFLEKFQYIEWNKLKWLNKSSIFLSVLSFYNISAPVLQLIAPFFILLIPFFILKVMNLPVTWNMYYKILIENIKHHAIGKLLFSLIPKIVSI